MELALQSSLFEHAERRDLGSGAWVEVRSGWLTDADGLFDELHGTASRGAPSAGRCTSACSTCRGWSASTTSSTEPAPHPRLKQMRRRLNDTYGGELGEPFTTAGLCLYRDGNDSVAWHGDKIGRSSTEDTMVAIVSLGATRVFALRPRGGGKSLRLRAPARRSVGDGRVVPAHMGALDPEDDAAGRPADQHPVPPARRPLDAVSPSPPRRPPSAGPAPAEC